MTPIVSPSEIHAADDGASDKEALAKLARAVSHHLRGNTERALQELGQEAPEGPLSAEILSARAHLQLEQQAFADAAANFSALLQQQPENSSAEYHLAHCLQQQGLWEEAEKLFRRASASEKYRFPAQLGAGICLLQLKRPEQALAEFEACLAQSPEHVQAQLGKAVAMQLMWDFDGAAKVYQSILEKNPQLTECLVNLVTLGMQRKDPGMVREYAARLLEVDPTSDAGLEGMVFAAFAQEDYANAAAGCKKLVQSREDRFDHWYNFGVALHNSGQPEQAEQAYRRAIELRPDAVQAFVNLGVLLQESGRLSEAFDTFERSLDLAPDREDLRMQVALLIERQGNIEDAEQRYNKLIERNPTLSYVWFRLGFLQLQRGANEGAARAFQACLRLRPEWPEAETNLALAHWRLENFDAAEVVLDKLITREPNNLDAVRGLATVCLARQRTEKAHYYHERLNELGERGAEVMYNKGLLAQKLGHRTEAIACYRSAVEANPEFVEALINLGHVLQEEGHGDAAGECWEKALLLRPELAKDYFSPSCKKASKPEQKPPVESVFEDYPFEPFNPPRFR
jgi:tetratricopeptide (TPR) repeat protein